VASVTLLQAWEVTREVCGFFGIPPPTDIRFGPESAYCIREEAVWLEPSASESDVAHEVGHHVFHKFYPGLCAGLSPWCEAHAEAVEKWWKQTKPTFVCEVCGSEVADLDFYVVTCGRCRSLYEKPRWKTKPAFPLRKVITYAVMPISGLMMGIAWSRMFSR